MSPAGCFYYTHLNVPGGPDRTMNGAGTNCICRAVVRQERQGRKVGKNYGNQKADANLYAVFRREQHKRSRAGWLSFAVCRSAKSNEYCVLFIFILTNTLKKGIIL